jgi:hypothetical protein
MRRNVAWFVALFLSGLVTNGCTRPDEFPSPTSVSQEARETQLAFDMDRDGTDDYWQYRNAAGRTVAVAFGEADGTAPGARIELDALAASDVPHFIIVLDGVPYEVVDALYEAGRFRLFHRPRKVICCFPSMTDLALSRLFHAGEPVAFEATYFDRARNRMAGGSANYLEATNSPWLAKVDYRCSFWWDAKAYLDPQAVFDHELAGMAETFAGVTSGQATGYSVGTAGLGTRFGREGIERYLKQVDAMCERILYQRRGRVKLTLTADHGHNLVECERITFDDVLRAGGYRLTKSLNGPKDVVAISYGLVTYAALYAKDVPGVADCLLKHEATDLVLFPRDGGVVVLSPDGGRATVRRQAGGWVYDAASGDPLRLAAIVERLRAAGHVSADGVIDAAALFATTVDHPYPDGPARVWEAFYNLVQDPPDVIVNLKPGTCHGSGFFHAMIGRVASTHGSLAQRSSVTFAATMVGALPAAMRSREVLPALERLRTGG